MDEADKNTILSNVKELIQNLDFYKIDKFLCERGVFTKLMMDDIKCGHDESEHTSNMLYELPKRGPLAFGKFLDILRETGHHRAILILRPNDTSATLACGGSQAHRNGIVDQNDTNSTRSNSNNSVYIPHLPGGHTVPAEASTRELQIQRDGLTYFPGSANVYYMNKRNRGMCLIINNIEFDGNTPTRHGSETDARRLDTVFQDLNFSVTIRTNKKKREMVNLLKSVAEFNHSEANALIIIILSHGDETGILGTDNEPIPMHDVYMMFSNIKCPTMKGKPKLFFLQACRGKLFDSGTEAVVADARAYPMNAPEVPKDNRPDVEIRLPHVTDICISYSTVEDYLSHRHQDRGSWYGRAIVNTLLDNQNDELHDILNKIDRTVQTYVGQNGEKQATERRYIGWYRNFYFNPGYFVD